MKDEQDYIRDIADMRSMMERSSKFLSLSGLAGIMAGIYALAGAFVRDVLEQNGATAGARILNLVNGGATFDTAFADVTGATPALAVSPTSLWI